MCTLRIVVFDRQPVFEQAGEAGRRDQKRQQPPGDPFHGRLFYRGCICTQGILAGDHGLHDNEPKRLYRALGAACRRGVQFSRIAATSRLSCGAS